MNQRPLAPQSSAVSAHRVGHALLICARLGRANQRLPVFINRGVALGLSIARALFHEAVVGGSGQWLAILVDGRSFTSCRLLELKLQS